jgi:hypothetical protein
MTTVFTSADVIQLAGFALGSWALGFGMGLVITSFRKFTDKI